MSQLLCLFRILFSCIVIPHAFTARNTNLFRDASQPIQQRVDNLLSQMTLKEKIYQLLSWDHSNYLPSDALPFGIGRFDLYTASKEPEGLIAYRNSAQQQVVNASRLGIPASFHAETNHGACPGCSVFPMPVNQGCTWNPSLINTISSIIAYESRLIGTDVLYAPVINMWTDPRFGRNSEAYSENPTLTSFYTRAATNGIQNNNDGVYTYLSTDRGIALAKHFAAYGPALGGLNAAPSDISPRTMFEIYLKPWRSFAMSSGGRAAMASHQTYNRVPMHANSYMINTIFRERFNFSDGQIVSDCNDIGVLQDYRIAANKSQAAARALIAGIDLDLICGNPEKENTAGSYLKLQDAVNSGWIAEDTIAQSARRVLAGKFAAGLFDDMMYVKDINAWKTVLDNTTAQAIAYQAAVESITLLQNKKQLSSLKNLYSTGKLKQLAIIGPNGDCTSAEKEGHLCDTQLNMLGPYTLSNGNTPIRTIAQAFRESVKYNSSLSVTYAKGVDIQSEDISGIMSAVETAKAADAVIIALGDSISSCGEWGDNDNLDPPGMQLQLLEAIVANISSLNIPLIVVLIHGRTFTFGANYNNVILQDIDLLFSAWRAGEKGGEAIRDIIMGDVENSGRLAQNWARSVAHVNSGSSPWLQEIRGKWVSNARSVPDLDGRMYDSYQNEEHLFNQYTDPLFAFGFGLSNSGCKLSEIMYSDLKAVIVNKNRTQKDDSVVFKVMFNGMNGCKASVTDVVQIYLVDPAMLNMNDDIPILVRYWKRLIGFKKVKFAPSQTVEISVDVRFDDIAIYVDEAFEKFELVSGLYTVRVGNSSRTDAMTTTVDL